MGITMDVYRITFAVLLVTCCWSVWSWHSGQPKTQPEKEEVEPGLLKAHGDPRRFRKTFLAVYLLVMGSDWLQGAYVYTLYKDEKNLSENTVANLFTCGFLAAAISALFIGSLADRYGRRLGCLIFCVTYAVSCLTKISNNVTILFIGRLLGGLSTTLMLSVFESWMVTEYLAQDLDKSNLSLDSMFGVMTTLNSIVAILSGVVGEGLVAATGTKVSPFMAAVVCLSFAFILMIKFWGENYGDSAGLKSLQIADRSTFKILQDRRILALGFISCCFEGSMYIFVFYWSAAMKSAHAYSAHVDHHDAADIPFGFIFATFMASMMLGSFVFTYLSSISSTSSRASSVREFFSPSMLVALANAGAAASILVTVLLRSEALTFWAFCFFETCIGIYFPAIGAQRAMVVDDGVRANIYGVLRIPLNIFVVAALTTTIEGDAHRDIVFVCCAGLLFMSCLASIYFLKEDRTIDRNCETADERLE